MKKNQNRGFTLIEMLAVIAIIAILVTIIVPVVSNASDKAAAAADAANLRSAKAAIAVALVEGNIAPGDTISAEDAGVPAKSSYEDLDFSADISDDGEITVLYGELTIEDLAYIAEHGEPAESDAEPAESNPG